MSIASALPPLVFRLGIDFMCNRSEGRQSAVLAAQIVTITPMLLRIRGPDEPNADFGSERSIGR